MDTWLIFHDLYNMRREDGVQYVSLIIGFEFVVSGWFFGKSGNLSLMRSPSTARRFGVRLEFTKQSALPRKFSKHNVM